MISDRANLEVQLGGGHAEHVEQGAYPSRYLLSAQPMIFVACERPADPPSLRTAGHRTMAALVI